HQKQNAVRITVHQPGHRRVRVLAARISHFPRRSVSLFDARYHLPADRAILVRGVDEIEKVWSNRERQSVIGERGAGVFLGRKGRHQALKLLHAGNSMLQLPTPVVPLRLRNVAPETTARGSKLFEGFEATWRWRLLATFG